MKTVQKTYLRTVSLLAARIIFLLPMLFLFCSGAAASPLEDSIRILEDRTAFRWGHDCFVWVVHYSEALIDPWVEAEAARVGMSESEREAYRSSFMSDLSIEQTEPLLVTVHAFGANPLNLSPFSEKIALVKPGGERVKPTRYDGVFDQPLSGLIQGLVFFPKQQDPDFAIAISGLGVFDERVFAFSGEGIYDYPARPEDDEPEVIIVELPPVPPAPAPESRPRPQPQPETAEPQAAVPQINEPAPPAQIPEPAVSAEPEVVVLEPEVAEDVAYSSREQTLRRFLDLWIKNDPAAMYSMLSDSSRRNLSRQDFEAELRKSSDFRNAIRDGYSIDWTNAEQGKVVVIRRFLFIRTLLNRNFGVVREGSAWKIVW